uniref:Uncharacterized protein n=1 Tax=Ammopiptanthus mongolicus TaxID=126911 RepID=A0A4P8PJK6_AMMMO|nr:hypothetical protein [Ammopiptanthus mongolicus]
MAKSGISLLIIYISNHATIRSESPRARTASSPSGSQIAGIVDPLRFAPRIPSHLQSVMTPEAFILHVAELAGYLLLLHPLRYGPMVRFRPQRKEFPWLVFFFLASECGMIELIA